MAVLFLKWIFLYVEDSFLLKHGLDYNNVITASKQGSFLCMLPTNERQGYNVTPSLIGWAHALKDTWANHHCIWIARGKLREMGPCLSATLLQIKQDVCFLLSTGKQKLCITEQ